MRSLWMDPLDARFPPLEQDLEVDVCVIGAGFSGIGAAWALKDTGRSFVVLEGRTVGSGATGRNGGFVLAGPAAGYEDAVRTLGPDATRDIWRLTDENNRWIGTLVEDLALECGYLRRGSMSLAASEEEWHSLQRAEAGLRADGVRVCLAERGDLPRPFDRLYLGGLYFVGNAEIQPAAFTRGVAARLPAGAVHEHTRVNSMRRRGPRWELRTDRAEVGARNVILATNAYTRSLFPDVPIAATRGQVLSTYPLDTVIVPFPMYADLGYQYWRQTPNGELVAGGWRNLDSGTEVGTEEVLHADIQEALLTFAARVTGERARVEHRWAGIMGFTPDMAPLVGPIPGEEGMYIAAGYSGHGVAMAFSCGARVASLATGGHPSIPACFAPGRFTGRE